MTTLITNKLPNIFLTVMILYLTRNHIRNCTSSRIEEMTQWIITIWTLIIQIKLRPPHIWCIFHTKSWLKISMNCLYENSFKRYTLCDKTVSNYNILSCFKVLSEREHLLENILDLFKVLKHNYLSLLGRTRGTSISRSSHDKRNKAILIVS